MIYILRTLKEYNEQYNEIMDDIRHDIVKKLNKLLIYLEKLWK